MIRSSLKIALALTFMTGSMALAAGPVRERPKEEKKADKDEGKGKHDNAGRTKSPKEIEADLRKAAIEKYERETGVSSVDAAKAYDKAYEASKQSLTTKQVDRIATMAKEAAEEMSRACSASLCGSEGMAAKLEIDALETAKPGRGLQLAKSFGKWALGKAQNVRQNGAKILRAIAGFRAKSTVGGDIANLEEALENYAGNDEATINILEAYSIVAEKMLRLGLADRATILKEAFIEFATKRGYTPDQAARFADSMINGKC